jgi:hypothetical protein
MNLIAHDLAAEAEVMGQTRQFSYGSQSLQGNLRARMKQLFNGRHIPATHSSKGLLRLL